MPVHYTNIQARIIASKQELRLVSVINAHVEREHIPREQILLDHTVKYGHSIRRHRRVGEADHCVKVTHQYIFDDD